MMATEWVPARGIKTQFHISEDRLRSLRQKWQYAKHFINTSDGSKPHYLYNTKAIEAYLMKHPSQRL
ncbi:MAG: hypothetical protein ACRC8Y_21835 [Chroococcales cyanobacterium]